MNNKNGWSEDNIKPLATFSTVDEFWSVYQHIKRPDKIPVGTTINVFQKGIKPVWETPEHAEGGCWNIRINKGYANQIWEDLLLGMIGDQFDCYNEVTGVSIAF